MRGTVRRVTSSSPAVVVAVQEQDGASILRAVGTLDSSSYGGLRDRVIKAALDEPKAVIVDVNRLTVSSQSAWSVFTSARWHVSIWPDIPILLVSSNFHDRWTIARSGVARYVPVYPDCDAALRAVDDFAVHGRRRGRVELPRNRVSIGIARATINVWLTAWSCERLIPTASTVATVFIENVLEHTSSAPVLVVEQYTDSVTVTVEDCCRTPAIRREGAGHGANIISGLNIVSVLSRAWGSMPTPSGKTVWAVVGSENEL